MTDRNTYQRAKLQDVLDAGPHADENWYRLQVAGVHTSKHLNVSAAQVRAIQDILDPPHDGAVFVVVTPTANGGINDLEVLDSPPRWDLSAQDQTVYEANVNGGDSTVWAGKTDFEDITCPPPADNADSVKLPTTCKHCGHGIAYENGVWIAPDATGDDAMWRETCDSHDTPSAEHEPDDEPTSPPAPDSVKLPTAEEMDLRFATDEDRFIYEMTLDGRAETTIESGVDQWWLVELDADERVSIEEATGEYCTAEVALVQVINGDRRVHVETYDDAEEGRRRFAGLNMNELYAANGKFTTVGELRSFLEQFPADTPLSISTPQGDGNFFNLIGANNPYVTGEPSVVLVTNDDFDVRQF